MKSIDHYTVEEVLKLLWQQHVDAYADAYPFYSTDNKEEYYDDDFWFDTEEQALLYAEEVLDMFQGFDNPFPIYRTIAIGKWDDLNHEDLGNHWSFDRESAINFAGYNTSGNVLISAMIRKEDVDWEQTIQLYEQFSGNWTDEDENEIYVPDDTKVFNVKIEQFRGAELQEMILNEVHVINEGVTEIEEISRLAKIIALTIHDDLFHDMGLDKLILINQVTDHYNDWNGTIELSDIVRRRVNINDFPKIKDFILNIGDLELTLIIQKGNSEAGFAPKANISKYAPIEKQQEKNIGRIFLRLGDVVWQNLLVMTLVSMRAIGSPQDSTEAITYAMQTIFNNNRFFDDFRRHLRNVVAQTHIVEFLSHELQHAYDDYVSKGKFISDKDSKLYYRLTRIYNKYPVVRTRPDFMEKYNRVVTHENYLNLHHEVRARLTSALHTTGEILKRNPNMTPRDLFLKVFVHAFSDYEILRGENSLKQIQKIFFRYYTYIKEKYIDNKETN